MKDNFREQLGLARVSFGCPEEHKIAPKQGPD